MSKKLQVEKNFSFICDQCGKEEIVKVGDKNTGWITITESISDGLRLFERPQTFRRYESFHVPNKQDRTYCGRECAFKSLVTSIDIFLSELKYKFRDN